MRTFRKLLTSVALPLALMAQAVHADVTHSGTVSMLRTYAGTADSTLSESWTFVQLAGLTSTSGCASGDEGVGDLAYLALPASERFMESVFVSAYLSGKNVSVTYDDANFLEGNCRIKHVSLIPFVEPVSSTPQILAFNHPNLIAAYTMDNISGTTIIDEVGVYNGTNNSATTVSGIVGSALSLSGANQFVDMGDNLDSLFTGNGAQFSVSLWVKLNSLGAHHMLFSKQGDSTQSENNRQIMFRVHQNNTLQFLWFSDVAGASYRIVGSTDVVTANQWQNIILTYDGSISSGDGLDRVEIYLNGSAVTKSLLGGGALGDIAASSSRFGLGGKLGAAGPVNMFLNGSLDQIRMFDSVLSSAEIADLYSEGSQ